MEKLKKSESKDKSGNAERVARLYKRWNIVGAVALGGAAIIAPPVLAGILTVGAGINVLQAGAGGWAERTARNSRLKKSKIAPKDK